MIDFDFKMTQNQFNDYVRGAERELFSFLRYTSVLKGVTMAALPNLVMLGLFYSLAFHMQKALGGWPTSIGTVGFPSALANHAEIATGFFAALVVASIFVLPLVILICLLVPGCRIYLPYLALYIVFFFGCIGLMGFAPTPYQAWWLD